MQQFKVIFYVRKTRVLADGSLPVYIRLKLNHSRLDVGATGQSVNEANWNASEGRATGKTAASLALNNILHKIENELMQVFFSLEHSDALSLDLIKATYLNKLVKPTSGPSFLAFFREYLQECEEAVGKTHVKATYTRYRLTYELFAEFLKSKHRRSDISFGELNYNIVHGFEKFLMVDKGYDNHNTMMKKMRNLKTVMIMARRLGKMQNDPFAGYKMRYEQVDRGYLTDEELKKMMEKKFASARLESVRDFFVFSCFTGLSYSDVSRLTEKNIVEMNGQMWIMINRQKTNVPSNVILLDIPKRIIEKYQGMDTHGGLLPLITNQKMNEYLKEIAVVCGIKKNLTFHLARHTFATMSLSKGVPMETVSKMLGHTNIRTTMIYARITNKKIEEDMLALSSKLATFNSFIEDNGTNVEAVKEKKRKMAEAG